MLELQVKELESKKENKKVYYIINLVQTFPSGKTHRYNKEMIFIKENEYTEMKKNKNTFEIEVKELKSKKDKNKFYYIANIKRTFKSGKCHRYNKEMIFITKKDYEELKAIKELDNL